MKRTVCAQTFNYLYVVISEFSSRVELGQGDDLVFHIHLHFMVSAYENHFLREKL